jgi:hypothetical protein
MTEQLNKAQESIQWLTKRAYMLNAKLFNSYLFGQLDEILKTIDETVGKYNLERVSQFALDMVEVMCKYVQVDLSAMDNFFLLDLMDDLADHFNNGLDEAGDLLSTKLALRKRESKWSVLMFTDRVYDGLALFKENRLVIERLILAFKRVFKAFQTFEQSFQETVEEIDRLNTLPGLIKYEK